MTLAVRRAVDLERGTDQLVDAICVRLSALGAVLDASACDVAPTTSHIRRRAVDVIDRLIQPDAAATATAVLEALWSHRVSADPPPSWWSTPLGALVAAALGDHPQTAVPRAQHNGDAR